MLGIPETTLEDELELLRWNCFIKPDIAWASIFQPYRGTKLGEYCVEKGYYQGNNGDVGRSFFDSSPLNFPPERKKQIVFLQKIFSVCAHLPEGHILARKAIKENKFFEVSKGHFYNILYS